MLFKKKFFLKIMLFKNARKTQKMRILWGELKQKVIFCVQFFFQNRAFFKKKNSSKSCFFKNIFFFKIMLFKNIFWFEIWRVVKILIQNLTLH